MSSSSSSSSPHLIQIPQAVEIAASIDPSINPALKQQAIEYLDKVKQLCEETWQDCLSLWLQGAGAGPSSNGKDGKQKLGTDLRMYCEHVVDTVLTHKSSVLTPDAQRAMYTAILELITAEWVSGPCEGGHTFLRNKLASTLAYLFLISYPDSIPTFLHPFLDLIRPPDPSSSTTNFHPCLLAIRLLSEIALEVHDPTIKSARDFTKERLYRDGVVRDAIRTTGDEKRAVDGLLNVAKAALEQVEAGDRGKWMDLADQSMKTLGSWTPWIDLSISLTPETLAFYCRLMTQPVLILRIPAVTIYRSLIARGMKDPAERLPMFRVLDIVNLLVPLESSTRGNDEVVEFRTAIGGVLGTYGSELLPYLAAENISQDTRNEVESLVFAAIPLVLRFMSDPAPDVFMSVAAFVSDLLRRFKSLYVVKPVPRGQMPPPPKPVSPETRELMTSILDISLRQLAWPVDAEWEAPTGDEPDPDDDLAQMRLVRITCRSIIESVALVDKDLHTDVVARIVGSSLHSLQTGGVQAVPWQQAELALHLVYTFGELYKNNTRAAFFKVPAELLTKSGRDRAHRMSINKVVVETSSGRSTPTSDDSMAETIPGVYYGGADRIDYQQYPLTILGQLLTRCIESGVINYPHPAVTLQYFEAALRYVEFWRSIPGAEQPMIEAMLDQRGSHHSDVKVRRRCFYLFTRFVVRCRADLEAAIVPPILESMKDLFPIDSTLPEPAFADEDVLAKATKGQTYISDQLHLFEAAGNLISAVKADARQQQSLLESVAGPLMADLAEAMSRPNERQAVLKAHNSLMALGNFAKGFPILTDSQVDFTPPYNSPFRQMTTALLQTLDVMKTQRVVRDAARFAFGQFVNAIGSSIAELVPGFVERVVSQFEPSELSDFLQFLSLLMYRLKTKSFETMDQLLLPLLSRIFFVLQAPITGTDDHFVHNRLKSAVLNFFGQVMNSNLDGVFITDRNKPEFENLLTALLGYCESSNDDTSQRLAFGFFSRSVIAWGTNGEPSVFAESAMSDKSKMVANGGCAPTTQHAVSKDERAAQALPGYENFIYQRLLPLCFNFPISPRGLSASVQVVYEVAILIRNTVQARGQEAVDYLQTDLLPKLQCPPEYAKQLIDSLKVQQSKDFRHTFNDFLKALRSS